MAYIHVPIGLSGIRSLVMFRPEAGRSLYELAQVLLRGESPIPAAERELIAAYTSSLNECSFCMNSHAAASRELFGERRGLVDQVLRNPEQAGISNKLKALLNLAAKVQVSGSAVTEEDIRRAKEHGASEREIHDSVLIAATFSMFNRYVDGLDSPLPADPAEYEPMGRRLAEKGYVFPQQAK